MKRIIRLGKRVKMSGAFDIDEGYARIIGGTGELIKELDFLLEKAKSIDNMMRENEEIYDDLVEELAFGAKGLVMDLNRISKKLLEDLEDYYW